MRNDVSTSCTWSTAQAVSVSVMTYGGIRYSTLPSGRSSRPRSRKACVRRGTDLIQIPARRPGRAIGHQFDNADATEHADVADDRQRAQPIEPTR